MSDEMQQRNGAAEPEWGIVELMGHRRRAGRIVEVERFGTKLLRVDIPVGPQAAPLTNGSALDRYVTEFYGGSAIYAVRLCDEDVARAAAASIGDPRPVAPTSYRLTDQSGADDDPDRIYD